MSRNVFKEVARQRNQLPKVHLSLALLTISFLIHHVESSNVVAVSYSDKGRMTSQNEFLHFQLRRGAARLFLRIARTIRAGAHAYAETRNYIVHLHSETRTIQLTLRRKDTRTDVKRPANNVWPSVGKRRGRHGSRATGKRELFVIAIVRPTVP